MGLSTVSQWDLTLLEVESGLSSIAGCSVVRELGWKNYMLGVRRKPLQIQGVLPI